MASAPSWCWCIPWSCCCNSADSTRQSDPNCRRGTQLAMEVKKSLSRLRTIRLLNIRTVARISWVPCMSWARPCHQITHFSETEDVVSLAKREDCQTPTAEIHPVLHLEILKPDLRRCSQRRRHAAQWLLTYRTRFNSAKATWQIDSKNLTHAKWISLDRSVTSH